MKYILILVLITLNLFSEEIIELNKTEYHLKIKRNKAILMDFPFDIEDSMILGDKDKIQGGVKKRSLHLFVDDNKAEVLIWGKGRKSILLSLKASRSGSRKFIFKDNGEGSDIESASNIASSYKTRAKIIESMSNMKNDKLSGFSSRKIHEVITIGNKIRVIINFRAKNSRYIAERWRVKNISNELVDVRTIDKLYKIAGIKANSFDKELLSSGESTTAYYVFKKSE